MRAALAGRIRALVRTRENAVYGGFLVVLGCTLLYASASAIAGYFETGAIAWGVGPRRTTGELALLMHGGGMLLGGWVAASGVLRVLAPGGFRH